MIGLHRAKHKSTASSYVQKTAAATSCMASDQVPRFWLRNHINPMVWHVILYSGSAAFLKLASFVLMLWLAKRFSVEDYAMWGLLFSFQIGVTLFGAVGIVEAVIALLKPCGSAQARGRLFAAANSVCMANLAIAFILATVLFMTVVDRTWEALFTYFWVLVSGGLLAYSSLQAQFVRLEEKHAASLFFNFVAPMAGLIGSIAALAYEMTVRSFYMGSALGLGSALVYGRIRGIGFHAMAESVGEWRPILKRMAPFGAVAFLGWLSGYGNNYVTKLWFNSDQVAKFTLAFMLTGILQLVASAMNQVWSPRFYRLTHEMPIDEVEVRNRRFFRWEGIALGLTGALLVSIFPIAARFLGGNLSNYQSMRIELFLLIVGYILIIPFWHCQNYLLVYDKGLAMMNLHFVSSVPGIAALLALLLLVGPIGIYYGFLIQMALRSAAAVVVTKKRWPVAISWGGMATGIGIAFLGFLLA